MPGISVAWQYDTKITAEAKFSNDLLNGYIYTEFVRFVNIIDLFQEDQKIIWKIIKELKNQDLLICISLKRQNLSAIIIIHCSLMKLSKRTMIL